MEQQYTRVALLADPRRGKGFEAVWQAESRLVRDAIVPMAAFAAVTDRIKIGSGVINNWTRNIGLLAATFPHAGRPGARPHHLRHRRVVGSAGQERGHRAAQTAGRHARDHRGDAPAAGMERVTFHGEFHHVDGIELDVVHGRREPRNVQVMIGATGPQMMELTGEIADGAVLNYCVPPEYNIEAMEQLAARRRQGRAQHRRDRPPAVDRLLGARRPQDRAGRRARAADPISGAAAAHRQSQRRQARSRAADSGDLGWPATKEQVRAAMKYVPDDLVQRITASGTPAEVKAKVREYIKYGATCPILYPLGDVKLMIDTFADGY
jgi:5,10-methylenetetrahydromethanopterin reductase